MYVHAPNFVDFQGSFAIFEDLMTSRHLGDKIHRVGDRAFSLEFFEDGGKIIVEIHIQKLEAGGLDPCALEKVGEIEGATKEECLKKTISWCREWVRK